MMLFTALLVVLLADAAASKLLDVYFRPGVDLKRDSARLLRSSSELALGGSVDVGYFFTHISLVSFEPLWAMNSATVVYHVLGS